jgi:hypothetical protein
MPYSKAQLIALANECALELGLPPVSQSAFESWILRKYFEGAQPHGVRRGVNPGWTYPESTTEVVREILALQSLGATRTTQMIICLWIFGGKFSHQQIRAALKSELRRIVNREQRGRPWWTHHYNDLRNISEAERAKRINQLPNLDSDLAAAGLILPSEIALEISLRAYWGSETDKNIASINFGDLHQNAESSFALPDMITMMFEIGGAIGPPEESATGGYEILDQITPDDLELARTLYLICAISLFLASLFLSAVPRLKNTKLAFAYEKAAKSFLVPEWIVPSAALFAISAFNVRHTMEGIVAK